jgi:hypothetical protein
MIIKAKPRAANNPELTWNGEKIFALMRASVGVDVVACW